MTRVGNARAHELGRSRRRTLRDRHLADDFTHQRLATRRATLQAVYTNMEVLLGGLQSQSTWLSGQISSLPQQSTGE